jgi:hypothetical protein
MNILLPTRKLHKHYGTVHIYYTYTLQHYISDTFSPFSTKRKFNGTFRFVVHDRSENPYEKMLCLFLAEGEMCPPHMVFKLYRLSPQYRSTQQQILTKQLSPWSRVVLEKSRHILWNLKVHCTFYDIKQRVPILIRMNLVHTFQSVFFRPSYISYRHLRQGLQTGIFLHI